MPATRRWIFGSAETRLWQRSSQPSAALVDSFIVCKGEAEAGEAVTGQHIAHLLVGVGVEGSAGNERDLFFNRPIEE